MPVSMFGLALPAGAAVASSTDHSVHQFCPALPLVNAPPNVLFAFRPVLHTAAI